MEQVDKTRNLGIIMDGRLRFESHVMNVAKCCFYRLKLLYKIRDLVTEDVRCKLCESLILSKFNYCDVVYGPCLLSTSKRVIRRVQNACCCFCFKIPPRSHVTPYMNKAGFLNMSTRRQLHLAGLLFNVIKYKKPQYLYNKLTWADSMHNTRCKGRILIMSFNVSAHRP